MATVGRLDQWRHQVDRQHQLFLFVAVGFVALAGLSAYVWHSSAHVFWIDVDASSRIGEKVAHGTSTSARLGAQGLIVRMVGEADQEPRPLVTARADDVGLAVLGDESDAGRSAILDRVSEIGASVELTDVSQPITGSTEDAVKALDDGANLVAIPAGFRALPRWLAWRLSPGLVIVPLTLGAIAGVIAARRSSWQIIAVGAAMISWLIIFRPSVNFGAGLAVVMSSLALVAGMVANRRSRTTALTRRTAPSPSLTRPRDGVRPATEVSHSPVEPVLHDGTSQVARAGEGLLVIGSPSRTAAHVGLAPEDQTHLTCLDGRHFYVLGVSAAGAKHLFEGDALEDFHAAHIDDDHGAVVVAVADGTSQADLASRGSRLAASTAADVLKSRLPIEGTVVEVVSEAVMTASEMLAKDAETASWPNGALATTLLAAVGLTVGGQRTIACARVGDSEAFLLDSDGWRRLFGDGSRMAGIRESMTDTIPSGDPRIETMETLWPDGAILVLATDGVADPLVGPRDTVKNALQSRWMSPPELSDFAVQVQFSRRGLDDDRTAVAVWPRSDDSGSARQKPAG